MNKKNAVKLIHEGRYAAEVDVELTVDESGWSPYLSVNDAYKLDTVRDALRKEDIKTARNLARVYTLQPV
jgi:hypothetical protein